MPICKICQHTLTALRFKTEHIGICTRCVNSFNESPEPAKNAEIRMSEMLARGMERHSNVNLNSNDEWLRTRARRRLLNMKDEVAAALPAWINKLLADPKNSTRDFKIMRAHRRGLLRMDGFADYPPSWKDVARKIRARDKFSCTDCGSKEFILDVHHIVYLSKHGTNQQSNLITLCRPCHESEHGRVFDGQEANDPESISPIQPAQPKTPPTQVPAKVSTPIHPLPSTTPKTPPLEAPQPIKTRATPVQWESARAELHKIQPTTMTSPAPSSAIRSASIPPVDLKCPRCATGFFELLTTAIHESQKARCPSCLLIFSASEELVQKITLLQNPKISNPAPSPPPSQSAPVPNRKPRQMRRTDVIVLIIAAGLIVAAVGFAAFAK